MTQPNYVELYEHCDGSGRFGWSVDTAEPASCVCGDEPSFDEALAAVLAAVKTIKGETT
jgi:hypothetical protein